MSRPPAEASNSRPTPEKSNSRWHYRTPRIESDYYAQQSANTSAIIGTDFPRAADWTQGEDWPTPLRQQMGMSYFKRPQQESIGRDVRRRVYDSGSESDFKYQPLSDPKAIRVLNLLPGRPSDELECTLDHATIDSAEPYEAISYVWGAPTDVADIVCAGKRLRIPRNLCDALLQLRHASEPRKFWADSICVNQRDDAEKTEQVALMRIIFRRAQKVLIWLGRERAELAGSVFDFARRVFRKDFDDDGFVQDSGIWRAFCVLFGQAWFWRIWCFQEVVLAREADVVWGPSSIAWEHLGFAATWIVGTGYKVLRRFPLAGVHNACLMYTMSHGGAGAGAHARSFLRLLMLTRQFECTNPVDRIYGLLGVPTSDADPEEGRLYVKPVYGKEKTVVYEEFAREVISRSQDMVLLSAVQHQPHSRDIKSWVPQWDRHATRSIISADFPAIGFSASRHLERVPPSLLGQQLVVHGLEVDSIEGISDMMPPKGRLAAEHWRIQDLWTAMAAPLSSYPNGTDLAAAFCWTLTAGKDWTGNSVQDEASHLADFAAFVDQRFAPEVKQSSKLASLIQRDQQGDSGRYMEAVCCSLCWRRFFITRKGYIGIGPACMLKGDKVCVLSGAIVPFILGREGSAYRLIGEAYVHGSMHGEACQRPGIGLVELTTFYLN